VVFTLALAAKHMYIGFAMLKQKEQRYIRHIKSGELIEVEVRTEMTDEVPLTDEDRAANEGDRLYDQQKEDM